MLMDVLFYSTYGITVIKEEYDKNNITITPLKNL
tara:strand:- start:200 stop:301 length:102 start_codon:yes stop_codon:yes gene_type:complete